MHQHVIKNLFSKKIDFTRVENAFKTKSNIEIIRAYAVFSTCLIPPLVNNATSLLSFSNKVFGKSITNFVMKLTFFGHFCGGEDEEKISPTVERLQQSGIGSILDYAAEADIEEEHTENPVVVSARTYDYKNEKNCDFHKDIFLSAIRSVNVATKGTGGFAAVKVTALGNPILLERMSTVILESRALFDQFDEERNGLITQKIFARRYNEIFTGSVEDVFCKLDTNGDGYIDYIDWSNSLSYKDVGKYTRSCRVQGKLFHATLTEEEVVLAEKMMARIEEIAELASKLNVKIMIDAEHSYFQPAIDSIALSLMKTYNKERAVVFTTYQMYLKSALDRLKTDIRRSEGNDKYVFAAKLVRGAYMRLEGEHASKMGMDSPICNSIADTHTSYNTGIEYCLRKIADGNKLEVMIASHNQRSCEIAIELCEKFGLTNEAPIYFGQLLGMADHLTYNLGAAKFKAYKYVPYGKVQEVMPYLIRRALENSDMLNGNVGTELKMLRQEMKRRILGR